nr:hypothetical protein [Polynucleobacter necessarius]
MLLADLGADVIKLVGPWASR